MGGETVHLNWWVDRDDAHTLSRGRGRQDQTKRALMKCECAATGTRRRNEEYLHWLTGSAVTHHCLLR